MCRASKHSMSTAFTGATLLGEVLASVLSSRGAGPECILASGAAAYALGFKVLSDLHEPYREHVTNSSSERWDRLGAELVKAGVPDAAKDTVLSLLAHHLARAERWQPPAQVATLQQKPPQQPAAVVSPALPPAFPSSGTSASSSQSARGRPSGTKEFVLPDELCDLKEVHSRLDQTIAVYDKCLKLQAAGVPGYSNSSNWKLRKVPANLKYWNTLGECSAHALSVASSRALLTPTTLAYRFARAAAAASVC